MYEVILKRFDAPDEVRTFDNGKFELVRIAGMTIGRATYQPGWKWSAHVGAALGKKSCEVEHVGLVLSGRATAAMDDGRTIEMNPATSSISLPATIAGLSATSPTSPCTSWAPPTTPRTKCRGGFMSPAFSWFCSGQA